jgi:hypothetical protein
VIHFVENHAAYFIGICLVAIVVVLCASILQRRKRHRPIFPRASRGARYVQGFASGRSLRNGFTSLGGAHGCLLISLVGDRLIVVPMFPFNLMFLPDIWRLEHDIRRKAIARVEERPGLFGKRLIIHFRTDRDERLELRLRRPDAFMKAIITR